MLLAFALFTVGANCDAANACDFKVVTAEAYADAISGTAGGNGDWGEPLLVTGAISAGPAWSAPFAELAKLRRGDYDDTTVSTGSGAAAAALFSGALSGRTSLRTFRRRLAGTWLAGTAAAATVFDTQNAAHGRNAPMAIPGVPARGGGGAEKGETWYNVLSVGGRGSGLPLHEHGAAWLALGAGDDCRKRWALYAPGHDGTALFRGLPAVQNASDWFARTAAGGGGGGGGGLHCVQPPGSVLLLPEGWAHATLNEGGECWAVGRQRPRQLREWARIAKRGLNGANPPASPPHALLQLGLALREAAAQPSAAAHPGEAAKLVQQAFGMLVVASGLQRQRRTVVAVAPPPPPPPAIRLKALFALLGKPEAPHWAGSPAMGVAKDAAAAAAALLQAELRDGAPAAAVAEALVVLGAWWSRVGGDAVAAAAVFEAAWSASPRGAAPLAALHAAVVLSQRNCTEAAAPLREVDRLRRTSLWLPSDEQAALLAGAQERCGGSHISVE